MIQNDGDDYNMNKPIVQSNLEIKPVEEIQNKEEETEETETEINLEPIEKDDIFEKPKQKIVDVPKSKPRREMSEKQKKHLQNLIAKNKQRALEKKQKLEEKLKKKELAKQKRLEKKREKEMKQKEQEIQYREKPIGQTKINENHFVNDLRKVDKRESKTDYYNDMEKMFGLFTRFQESQASRNEKIIERRVQEELQKRQRGRKVREYVESSDDETQQYNTTKTYQRRQQSRQEKQKPQSYTIDFSQYSHGGGYNRSNPYGF